MNAQTTARAAPRSEPKTVEKKEVTFSNGNRAHLVVVPANDGAAEALRALGLEQPKAVVMLSGGADELDEALMPSLTQMFSRGIARAAADTGALVIDGGTDSGVMKLMGQGVADRRRKSSLLGVAPSGKVSYPGAEGDDKNEERTPLDANHSHFVLVETNVWGGETETMFALAEELGKAAPVLTLVVNGGEVVKAEVLQSVRRGWPLIVFEGSGRMADEIARLWTEKPRVIPDPVLAEIIADGRIQLFPVESSVSELQRLIIRQLGGDEILRMAWERFALYDSNAGAHQKDYNKLLRWVLMLGVAATFLVLAQKQLETPPVVSVTWPAWWVAFLNRLVGGIKSLNDYLSPILRYPIILVPIATSGLLAWINRFKAGHGWVLLRGSAEALKQEIYGYRARAGIYGAARLREAGRTRETQLSERIEQINRRLMETEVNTSALKRYDGPIPPKYGKAEADDGLSDLTPERYVIIRLGDQLDYYEMKTGRMEQQIKRLQLLIYVFGGVGTFLAAVGAELWIALTTALTTALAAFIGQHQLETTLIKFNQTATALINLRAWWTALSPTEQLNGANISRLVEETEAAMQAEQSGWVQRMQRALSDAAQTEDARKKEAQPDAPQTPAPRAPQSPVPPAKATVASDGDGHAKG